MFASLRFPDTTPAEEVVLDCQSLFPEELLSEISFTDPQKQALSAYLPRACANPRILSYRGELAAEILNSPPLEEVFSRFCQLYDTSVPDAGTEETKQLQRVARFEEFSAKFDEFYRSLDGIFPQSSGAKRFFRFCKTYGESFEYRELKSKAAELIQAFGFDRGATLTIGNPTEEGTALLSKQTAVNSILQALEGAEAQFGVDFREESSPIPRPYTPIESAVLTGLLRNNTTIVRRMEEFFVLYEKSKTEEMVRLSREAAFFTAMNKIYRRAMENGYPVCLPTLRPPGFYTEIYGLAYPSTEGTVSKSDYTTSPLNHITVVCGPDSAAYLTAVGFAHLCASTGGLVFAERAEIAPINRMERDREEQLHTDGLDENSLCLCGNLFDAMLPRQEDAAVGEVLRCLGSGTARSVVRICAKSNLAALEKQIKETQLPDCTLLQAGTDRTLEELLQKHNLTVQNLNPEEETK